MKKARIRKIAWKVAIISVVILAVSAYYLAPWIPLFPMYYSHLTNWWEEKTGPTTEELRAKRLAYLENLTKPELTGKEIASILKKEKGIYTKALYDMVDWYVYHGDEDVIRQVLANRQFEMKITLPRVPRSEGGGITTDYTVYDGYNGPSWGTDIERLIHHQEFHKYAANKDTDPHFISYLLLGIGVTFSTEEYRNRYAQQLFYDDILAYLRVYVNYKDWPTIKEDAEYEITHYPCGWRDWDTIDEVLKIAEEQGVEPAYELYMQRYRSNYRKITSLVLKDGEWRDKYKYERSEIIFLGWLSENIKGEVRVYNVDSNEAVINIRYIGKIISVLRDGEDITNLCHLTPENVMIMPLKKAEVIELKFKVSVVPKWWNHYHPK